jgi:hypothetical protein
MPIAGTWLCPACLVEQTPGNDTSSKVVSEAPRADWHRAQSRRERAAGDIEAAVDHDHDASRSNHRMGAMLDHGNSLAGQTTIVQGEAVPKAGYYRDTLADPDLTAIEASEARGAHAGSKDESPKIFADKMLFRFRVSYSYNR